MEPIQTIIETVQEKYGALAEQSSKASGCCGSACGCSSTDAIMADDYSKLQGYIPDADLALGCGLPTEYAGIREGDTVVDLGSGAGNDCFVARFLTGFNGKVIGVDFTQAMIDKARANVEKLGYSNVEFRLGDIENLPVNSETADVIVSNCVLNLVPDKKQAFSETFRVLKPGGHFSISDIVLDGELPTDILQQAEMYVGCVSGAIQKKDYMDTIRNAGFKNVKVQKEKVIDFPDELLTRYLSAEQLDTFRRSGARVLSITVYGEK